jgi:hypothetical protein
MYVYKYVCKHAWTQQYIRAYEYEPKHNAGTRNRYQHSKTVALQQPSVHPLPNTTLHVAPAVSYCSNQHAAQSDIATARESKTHTNKTHKKAGNMQQHSETTDSAITAPRDLPHQQHHYYSDAPFTHISILFAPHRTTGVTAKCCFVIILSVGNNY